MHFIFLPLLSFFVILLQVPETEAWLVLKRRRRTKSEDAKWPSSGCSWSRRCWATPPAASGHSRRRGRQIEYRYETLSRKGPNWAINFVWEQFCYLYSPNLTIFNIIAEYFEWYRGWRYSLSALQRKERCDFVVIGSRRSRSYRRPFVRSSNRFSPQW